MAKNEIKARGGRARAAALSAEQRSEVARAGAAARWDKEQGVATAAFAGDLVIGDSQLRCYVLETGDRILSTRGIMESLRRTWRGRKYTGTELPVFLEANNLKPFISDDLRPVLSPVIFRTDTGARGEGFRAEILPAICEIYLRARDADKLTAAQESIAQRCEILVRGLSRTGIIALIDEATGYQNVRASDALAQILQAFIAKELQPWIHTFPDDYYRQMFRLRGLEFPRDTVRRPQYFGHLTNDVIYKRLAPGVLEELRKSTPKTPKGRRKHQLHRRLTVELGHPKLREHLSSVVTIMKLSDDYEDFHSKLNRIHPTYGETIPFDFGEGDDGGGL